MKRQKHKAKRNHRTKVKPATETTAPQATPSRRSLLSKVGSGALVVAVLGGGGWYLVEDVKATVREEDLSRIGNGTPSVVQIHDPQCPSCVALQREARSAMDDFDDSELQFLVANITTSKGQQLAREHNVGHVTLLLFDSQGNMKNALVGVNESDLLSRMFRRHIGRSGS